MTKAEFSRYVLDQPTHSSSSNSQHVKDERYDNALLAKLFFDRVRENPSSVKLSEKSSARIEDLPKRLVAAFE